MSSTSPIPSTKPLQLYSGPLSLFTAMVGFAIAEKEIRYQRIQIPFRREYGFEPKYPEVL